MGSLIAIDGVGWTRAVFLLNPFVNSYRYLQPVNPSTIHNQQSAITPGELKPFWQKYFGFNWKFGLFLILIICVPRFLLVLHANATANYRYIGLLMVTSALAPYVFLTRDGRKKIGMKWSAKYDVVVIGFFIGLFCSLLIYVAGDMLFGSSYENWYVYIGRSYNIPAGIAGKDKAILFAVMAGTGMIFSPIGEELFFRGIVHSSFANSVGERKASYIDGAAFALTHISHFGLVYVNRHWEFLIGATLNWVLYMFFLSLVFNAIKKDSGSLVGAIFCHAAFNLGMIYCIFYLL